MEPKPSGDFHPDPSRVSALTNEVDNRLLDMLTWWAQPTIRPSTAEKSIYRPHMIFYGGTVWRHGDVDGSMAWRGECVDHS
jgi:hypothetical protein